MNRLNKVQLEAIQAENNVVVILAGAGSGKTTVLVKKIEYLILEQGVEPGSILAITFTNKAAKEMKERLTTNLGPYASAVWVMTFHAFAVRVIRQQISKLPAYNQKFLIIDDDDKKKILKKYIKDNFLELKPQQCVYAISSAKAYATDIDDVEFGIDEEYRSVYRYYTEYLKANNAMDFDDLLLYAHWLLSLKDVQVYYQTKFKYIHVDEFQDTSSIQAEMLKYMKSSTNKLFIVGDIDQSIYTWRGAVVDNMLKIEQVYKDVKIIKLEQNYRSTSTILDSANSLIENNLNRFEKELWTENVGGQAISWTQATSMNQEATNTVREIDSLIDNGHPMNEIAVLYRYNYQSRKVEEELVKKGISYVLYGGLRFYERMEIKDVLAYLRLIVNPNDNISFLRVANVPKRKVGEIALNKLMNYATDNQTSYLKAGLEIGAKSLREFIEKVTSVNQVKLIEDFQVEVMNFLQAINYFDYLTEYDDKGEERRQNVEELLNGIAEILSEGEQTLEDYLSEVAIFSEKTEVDEDTVVLSTIHGAKGLEFDSVFVIGMCEGKFPKEAALFDETELEEERRLCYVAITRARHQLYVSNYLYDYTGNYLEASRFIGEMGIESQSVGWDDFIF
ncbi:MAG: ATP-dependent helicase [Mycoplasmatales bacterium]